MHFTKKKNLKKKIVGPAMQRRCADGAGVLFAHWQGLSLTSFTPSTVVAKLFLVFQERKLC